MRISDWSSDVCSSDLARCTQGVEENDNTEMGEIVGALDILKQETGACVHLVHHSGAGDSKRARGATAFDGAVDAEFYTKRDMEKTPDLVELVSKFQKDIPESDTVQMVTIQVAGSLVLNGGTPVAGGSRQSAAVAPALATKANVLHLESNGI